MVSAQSLLTTNTFPDCKSFYRLQVAILAVKHPEREHIDGMNTALNH